jgi:hypothetical protein
MDEPTYPNESQFWDEVADWLLDARGIELYLSVEEIEALLRAKGFTQAGPEQA